MKEHSIPKGKKTVLSICTHVSICVHLSICPLEDFPFHCNDFAFNLNPTAQDAIHHVYRVIIYQGILRWAFVQLQRLQTFTDRKWWNNIKLVTQTCRALYVAHRLCSAHYWLKGTGTEFHNDIHIFLDFRI